MLIHETEEIQFIDFELSGTHYRGYDLAKFFRSTRERTTDKRVSRSLYQQAFWESYYTRTLNIDKNGHDHCITKKGLEKAVAQLEWEAQLLEPMTWLEAASFFLSMASLDDPSETEKWINMANKRLSSFETMQATANKL